MSDPRLAIVGGGKMGGALVRGLLDRGWAAPGELCVVEVAETVRETLAAAHPGLRVEPQPVRAEGAVLAVKPEHVVDAARAAAEAGCGRFLSIAAGVRLARIEAAVGADVPVVRAMPNTPAQVGVGAAAIAPGAAAGADDLAWAEGILSAVGRVVRLEEGHLDAVTGLSGSGPAYVFLVAEALAEAGVLVGLPRPVATELAAQTLLGAATLLADGDAAALRAAVTSPGGTTAAGLRALERGAVRSALIDAVVAATDRSRELGRADSPPPAETA